MEAPVEENKAEVPDTSLEKLSELLLGVCLNEEPEKQLDALLKLQAVLRSEQRLNESSAEILKSPAIETVFSIVLQPEKNTPEVLAIATEIISNIAASESANVQKLINMRVLFVLSRLLSWLAQESLLSVHIGIDGSDKIVNTTKAADEPSSNGETKDKSARKLFDVSSFDTPTGDTPSTDEYRHLNTLDSAVWAIGNIAGDGTTMKDLVNSSNIFTNIMKNINLIEQSHKLTATFLWAAGNMVGRAFPPKLLALGPVAAAALDRFPRPDITRDALFLLSKLSLGADINQRTIGALPGIVPKLLCHITKPKISETALSVIGNLLSGESFITQLVVSHGVIPALMPLLTSTRRAIRKLAFWCFSNILAEDSDSIHLCITNGVLDTILLEIESGGSAEVRKEAFWCLTNCVVASNASDKDLLAKAPRFISGYYQAVKSHEDATARHALLGLHHVIAMGEKLGGYVSRGGTEFCDPTPINPFVEYMYAMEWQEVLDDDEADFFAEDLVDEDEESPITSQLRLALCDAIKSTEGCIHWSS